MSCGASSATRSKGHNKPYTREFLFGCDRVSPQQVGGVLGRCETCPRNWTLGHVAKIRLLASNQIADPKGLCGRMGCFSDIYGRSMGVSELNTILGGPLAGPPRVIIIEFVNKIGT